VLKRYVQLIGGDVKNLTKDPLPGRGQGGGGGGGGGQNAMGSYGPASAGGGPGPPLGQGQYVRGGGDARGVPGLGGGVGAILTSPVNVNKTDFSQEVKDRLRMMVGRNFCSDEDLRDEKVRSKLLALSDKDALNSIDELLGVDPTIIRNFSSYFLGIVNRYARGEGRAQREEARRKRSGGAEPVRYASSVVLDKDVILGNVSSPSYESLSSCVLAAHAFSFLRSFDLHLLLLIII
jgi:hypothetical protein